MTPEELAKWLRGEGAGVTAIEALRRLAAAADLIREAEAWRKSYLWKIDVPDMTIADKSLAECRP